jgi:UDP-N-acetylmuramate dehydrogenase
MRNTFQNHLPEIKGSYKENAPLSHYTWFKVGGKAEILYKPYDLEDLCVFLKEIDKSVPLSLIGAGSNIIIRDGGIDGVVIRLGRNFNDINILPNNLIEVGASMLNMNLSSFCLDNEIGGLEFLSGIPGSIGGGIAMNAGAYGKEFKDIVESITSIDRNGNIHILKNEEIKFSYRRNGLSNDLIFISAKLHYYNDNKLNIKKHIDEINLSRRSTQPILERTGGSTFANPENNSAWKLIDNVGLRGYHHGYAKFSEKHCNFLINTGNATAKDLEDLGELARKKVLEKFDINLHWEIKRLGKYE